MESLRSPWAAENLIVSSYAATTDPLEKVTIVIMPMRYRKTVKDTNYNSVIRFILSKSMYQTRVASASLL